LEEGRDDAWYFEAVGEIFGHLYGAMTSRSASQAEEEAGNDDAGR